MTTYLDTADCFCCGSLDVSVHDMDYMMDGLCEGRLVCEYCRVGCIEVVYDNEILKAICRMLNSANKRHQ